MASRCCRAARTLPSAGIPSGGTRRNCSSPRCLSSICSKLKQFRAVGTRYDKRERIYQGTIEVASISIWLRDPVP